MNEQSKIDADERGKLIATVEVKKIGNSHGIILPKDLLARMQVSAGDKLYATLIPGGGFRLTAYDPDFEKAMEVARRGMKRYHNALADRSKGPSCSGAPAK